MSRSGYSDDCENLGLWRGAVARAIKGARGQQLLRDLRDALDAMPAKRLIAFDLVQPDGEVCALGAVAKARGVDVALVDPEDPDAVAKVFGIAHALAAEIAYVNDEAYWGAPESPEHRWQRVREWAEENILPGAGQ